MCTVTYLPLDDGFILTSNRDESPKRKTIEPKEYCENGVKLIYPKDKTAGGTWVGVSEKNRLVCLLNGGFKKHKRAENYKMSRGVIVKNLLISSNAISDIKKLSFEGIEPFTIILADWSSELQIFELVWTGKEKFVKKLEHKPYIWSSSTLYDEEMKQIRKKWFSKWLSKEKEFNLERAIEFHQKKIEESPEISIKMKRHNVETVSTTCITSTNKKITIKYIDYINKINSLTVA